MGVPGLYTYLVNQYKPAFKKKINKKYKTLSLDMNAIIHPVSQKLFKKHPKIYYLDLKDELFNMIYERIEYYVDKFEPEKLILAFDGPAPVAKIQQQRTRRFQTEDENLNDNRWSSTHFSPGTQLMEDLSKFLKERLSYIARQLSPKFKNVIEIVYSSHRVPGEGEHKIMNIIRKEKGPHLIIGNDADLILLSMSNRWDTDIFRESENKNKVEETFIISSVLKKFIKKDYQTIENFILITFFVGNDFILPIAGFNSIQFVLEYMKQFLFDEPLTTNKDINWVSFLSLLSKLKIKAEKNELYNNILELKYDEIGQKSLIKEKNKHTLHSSIYHTLHEASICSKIRGTFYDKSVEESAKLWFIMVEWIYRYYMGYTINCSVQYTYSFRPNIIQLYEYLKFNIKTIQNNKGFQINQKIPPFFTPVKALICMIPFSNINLVVKSARLIIKNRLGDLFPNTFIKLYDGVLRDHQVEIILPIVSYNRIISELSDIDLGPLDKFEKDIYID
jgi:5'-3' exonuclease